MKNFIRKIVKFLLYTFMTIILAILLYFLSAILLSRIALNSDTIQKSGSVDIFILSNGLHADIVVPIINDQIDWSEFVKFGHTLSRDTTYKFVAFGWGDKEFYLNTPTWSDLRFAVAFQALFLAGRSAIHATFFHRMVEGENCFKISLSERSYHKLINFIKKEFQLDQEGNLIPIINFHYETNDSFYEGTGTFTLFKTCNTWVNDALKYSDQKACLWTPFVEGIFYQYKN